MPVLVDTARTTALSLEPCSRLPEERCIQRAEQCARGGTRTFIDLCQAVCRARTATRSSLGDRCSSARNMTGPVRSWHRSGQHGEPFREAHMDSSSSPSGSSAYLESLMRAGQQSMKQFDDALVSAMGVEGKPATRGDSSPFAVAANLQRQFWSPIVEFWKGTLGNASAAGAQPSRRDRRFQDEAWQHSPYYQLIKTILLDDLKAIGRARRSSPGRRKIKAAASLLRASIH